MLKKKDIDKLFTSGKRRVIGNIMIVEYDGVPGYVISAPIKKFKRAVDRNRIKRMIRENIRNIIPTKSIGIIFIGSKVPKKLNFNLDI